MRCFDCRRIPTYSDDIGLVASKNGRRALRIDYLGWVSETVNRTNFTFNRTNFSHSPPGSKESSVGGRLRHLPIPRNAWSIICRIYEATTSGQNSSCRKGVRELNAIIRVQHHDLTQPSIEFPRHHHNDSTKHNESMIVCQYHLLPTAALIDLFSDGYMFP